MPLYYKATSELVSILKQSSNQPTNSILSNIGLLIISAALYSCLQFHAIATASHKSVPRKSLKTLSAGQKKKAVETAFVCTLPGVHMRKNYVVCLYYSASNYTTIDIAHLCMMLNNE